MFSDENRPTRTSAQSIEIRRQIPMGMHLAGLAAFLLWRGYYFFTVVVIPALGWR